jgi:hypothetical protein
MAGVPGFELRPPTTWTWAGEHKLGENNSADRKCPSSTATATHPSYGVESHSERIPRSLAPGLASDYKDSLP